MASDQAGTISQSFFPTKDIALPSYLAENVSLSLSLCRGRHYCSHCLAMGITPLPNLLRHPTPLGVLLRLPAQLWMSHHHLAWPSITPPLCSAEDVTLPLWKVLLHPLALCRKCHPSVRLSSLIVSCLCCSALAPSLILLHPLAMRRQVLANQ